MSTSRAARFRPHIARMAVVAVVAVGAVVGVPAAAEGAPAPAEPLLATNVAASPGDTTATVTWTAATSPDVVEYGVLYRPVGFAWNPTVLVGAAQTSTTLTGLANGTTYEVAVAVRTAAGWHGQSDVVQVTPAGPSVMTAYSVPATPVLGEEFRVYFAVTIGGAPATGTIDVTFANGSTSAQTLTDGVYSAGIVQLAPGTLTMSAVYNGGPGVLPSSAAYVQTFAPGLTPQTIALDAALPDSAPIGSTFDLPELTSAGLVPVYETSSAACSVSGGVLTLVALGSCTIVGSHPGSATTEPVSVSVTLTVTLIPDTFALADWLPATAGVGDVLPLPDATVGGVPFAAVSTGWPCSLQLPLAVQALGMGTCTLSMHSLGDATHEAVAESVQIVVGLATQTIGLDDALPESAAVVSTLPLPTETSAGLPVTSLSTTPAVCTVSGSTLSLVAPGTCSVESSNAGDATHSAVLEGVSFTVMKRAQTIELLGPPPTWFGAGGHSVWARSSEGLPVTITVSGPCRFDGMLMYTGVGECVITASSAGSDLVEPASAVLRTVVSPRPAAVELVVQGAVGDRAAGTAVYGWFSGLEPGATMTMTVESTPVLLGTATSAWDGESRIWSRLPTLSAGTHRLILTGRSLDGTPVRAELAFGVGADGRITWIGQPGARGRLAATGSDVDTTVPLAVLLLATGVGLLGARRRLLAGEPG